MVSSAIYCHQNVSVVAAKRYLTRINPSSSSSSSALQMRYLSAGKGPPSGGNGGGGNDDNGNGGDKKSSSKPKTRQDDSQKKNAKRSKAIWAEQQPQNIFNRRPRFGPKSKKYFETAVMNSSHKQYGIRTLNLKLVKDSSDVPILIPGRTLLKEEPSFPKSSSSSSSSDKPTGGRRRKRKLPILNAMALLDTAKYCKKSAKPGGIVTKSGHEAAKRLLRGKKELVDMLRGHIIFQDNQRPFCLAGHGVPKQLLQDHLNFADSILQKCDEPAECSFSSSNVEDAHDKDTEDPYHPDCMKIRGHDGKSRIWAWPPPLLTQREILEQGKRAVEDEMNAAHTWEERLTFYLAVMDRFTSKLGLVGSYLQKESRKQWKVTIYRGMAYPLELVSTLDGEDDDGPVPILEWSPLNRVSNKQAHVSIRLQGIPEGPPVDDGVGRTGPRDPVTLVYDAIFQEDPRLEPIVAG